MAIAPQSVKGQQENTAIRKGNKLYKEGQYDKALTEYQQAVQQNPNNQVVKYNIGNTKFRSNDFPEAQKSFEDVLGSASPDSFKEKAWYNKGVSLSKQQKLQESIEAYKNALKLNPNDEDARINLQKALSELKKQNESKEPKKQDQKKQQQNQKQKQKPPPSKLDRKQIEQYLKSLQQKEQEVQRKIQQNKARSVTQPDKDW